LAFPENAHTHLIGDDSDGSEFDCFGDKVRAVCLLAWHGNEKVAGSEVAGVHADSRDTYCFAVSGDWQAKMGGKNLKVNRGNRFRSQNWWD
jgi:hypothetical protein